MPLINHLIEKDDSYFARVFQSFCHQLKCYQQHHLQVAYVLHVKLADLNTTSRHNTEIWDAMSWSSHHHCSLSVVLLLSTRPHSSQADPELSGHTQWIHCAPLKPKIMVFAVAVIILVISESLSAQLLFPLQIFPSVAKPETQCSLSLKHTKQSETGAALTSHIPTPKKIAIRLSGTWYRCLPPHHR